MLKIFFSLLLLIAIFIPTSSVQAIDCPSGTEPYCASTKGPPGADGLCLGAGGRGKVNPTCVDPTTGTAPAAGGAPTTTGPSTSGSGQRCYLTADNKDGTPIPVGQAPIAGSKTGISTAIGCIPTQPQELVEGLLRFGTLAAGGIAFLLMILGALGMITAEGNPEAIKHAQEMFYSAIIGLLLIIFSVLLMQVIGVDVLDLPGFGR